MKHLIEYLPPEWDRSDTSYIMKLCAAIEQYVEDRERARDNETIWQAWLNQSS